MAKLGSYYGLCPLIDYKSLLGVSEDVTPGCVIVTLGKNMAIIYKLSDQKQIFSWSTKDKLSSPVIYDKKRSQYIAIFNQFSMRAWDQNENSLEKVKKIRFSVAVHTIIACDDDPIVIFKDGRVMCLTLALENRKEIPENEIFDKTIIIEEQSCLKINDKYFVGMLLKSGKKYSYMWVSPDINKDDKNMENAKTIELKRSGVKLNGHLVMLTDWGPKLFTLWSDGRLYTQDLDSEAPEVFYSIIETLSRGQPVCLVALNSTYLVMYGADNHQEGASLQIYNIQFKVIQTKLQLKLFTIGSKLWTIGNCILLTIGQNLAVVPFHLATEQLAALVGSHRLISVPDEDVAIVTEMIVETWDSDEKTVQNENPLPELSIKSQVAELIKEGWSEAAISEHILPKLIEKKDITAILMSIDYFTDIPESIIVKLLSYCLQRIINTSQNVDILNKRISGQNGLLLDKILTLSYCDVLLLPHLRTGLKFEEMLIFIQYLCYLLGEKGHVLSSMDFTESEHKIIEWGCLLLDSHYQQLLLTKETKIIEILQYFKALIDTYMLCMDDYKQIEPILGQIKKGKKSIKLNNASLKYSVEELKLY